MKSKQGWTSSVFHFWNEIRNRSSLTPLILFFLTLPMLFASSSFAGGSAQVAASASNYLEETLVPLLIREKLCISKVDCWKNKKYFAWAISYSDAIDFDLYDINDERICKEIILSMLNSEMRIQKITFWKSQPVKKSLFETPILEYVDHTGDK